LHYGLVTERTVRPPVELAEQEMQTDPDQNPEYQSEQRHELSVNANLPGRQSFDGRDTPTSRSFRRHRDDPSASNKKKQPFPAEKEKQLRETLQNGEEELTDHIRTSCPIHMERIIWIATTLTRYRPAA
jgi:hypothetical protein